MSANEKVYIRPEMSNSELAQSCQQQMADLDAFIGVVKNVRAFSYLKERFFQEFFTLIHRNGELMTQGRFLAKLHSTFSAMKRSLKEELRKAEYVCTTADVWTVRGRTYLGITCHWIEERTLTRKSAALACTRIHWKRSIAIKMREVHADYDLRGKVFVIVTDNRSSFLQIFEKFSDDEFNDDNNNNNNDDKKNIHALPPPPTDVEFQDLDSLLRSARSHEPGYWHSLPPHVCCVTRTLSLVISEDLHGALTRSPMNRIYRSVMAKCSRMFHAERRRRLSEEDWDDPAPLWTSELDCLYKISSSIEARLDETCALFGVPKFLQRETSFLREFRGILEPLATSMDLLQGERNSFLGLVLPTLAVLKTKLLRKLPHFLFDDVIRDTVKAIEARFEGRFSGHDAKFTTVVLPWFRLWWLSDDGAREANDALLERVGRMKGRRVAARMEINDYLEGQDRSIESLHGFPVVKRVFLKYNAPLCSSAPVERLFSSGGEILTARRDARLDDEDLEKILIVRYNTHEPHAPCQTR